MSCKLIFGLGIAYGIPIKKLFLLQSLLLSMNCANELPVFTFNTEI